jgi:hypothetical protein
MFRVHPQRENLIQNKVGNDTTYLLVVSEYALEFLTHRGLTQS